MIPTHQQFENAKLYASRLILAGYTVKFRTRGNFGVQYPNITIQRNKKVYHFSEPDWNVVVKQLKTLLETTSTESST